MSVNQSCTGCGADLEQVPDGQPCPHCASNKRSIHAAAAMAASLTMTGTLSITVEYNPVGSWEDQWRRTLRHLDEIKAAYSGSRSTEDLTQAVQQFFVACWHLNDYIRNDKTNLPTLDEARLQAYRSADPYLPVAQAFANTFKHLYRTRPGDPVARVKSTRIGPPGNTATVSYEVPPQSEVEYDALQLAENCVNAWGVFLASEGISLPT